MLVLALNSSFQVATLVWPILTLQLVYVLEGPDQSRQTPQRPRCRGEFRVSSRKMRRAERAEYRESAELWSVFAELWCESAELWCDFAGL